MTSLDDSSKICCSVRVGLLSEDCQHVATTVEELKDQALVEMRAQLGPSGWDKAAVVCLEDGSEILSTAALKEHVSDGHLKFVLVNSKLAPFERARNLDYVCRLLHKLTEIGGAQAIRGNRFGIGPGWKERIEIIIQADTEKLARKLGLDEDSVHRQQSELYKIMSCGVSSESGSEYDGNSD